MFETVTIMDEDLYQEIGKYLLRPGQRRMLFCMLAGFLCLGAVFALLRATLPAVVAVLGALALLLEYFILQKTNAKTRFARLSREAGSPRITYTTRLDEAGVFLMNHETCDEILEPYDRIVRLGETNRLYVLITKEGRTIPIAKEDLDEEACAGLLSLLKAKATGMRR